MTGNNTTRRQDDILTRAEEIEVEFGSITDLIQELLEIVTDLDDKLTEAKDTIDELSHK
jgi:hypothetical protein